MPFLNKVSGGSARRFGFSRRSIIFTCNTNTGIVTLNNADKKCYYPANYSANASYSCPSGGSVSGVNCVFPSNYGASAGQSAPRMLLWWIALWWRLLALYSVW